MSEKATATYRIVENVFEFRSPSIRPDKDHPMQGTITFLAKDATGNEVELVIEGHVLANIRSTLNSAAEKFPTMFGPLPN